MTELCAKSSADRSLQWNGLSEKKAALARATCAASFEEIVDERLPSAT